MNKEEFLKEILSNSKEVIVDGTEDYDYPEYENVIPVWWVKYVTNQLFKDDPKYNNTNNCYRDIDHGDVDEY